MWIHAMGPGYAIVDKPIKRNAFGIPERSARIGNQLIDVTGKHLCFEGEQGRISYIRVDGQIVFAHSNCDESIRVWKELKDALESGQLFFDLEERSEFIPMAQACGFIADSP